MRFNNDDSNEVYVDQIVEWMATLKKVSGNNPPMITKLTGQVNRRDIELSFVTFSQLGHFDTG
jgi:hypothetical protein